jgi:hypothetical protein
MGSLSRETHEANPVLSQKLDYCITHSELGLQKLLHFPLKSVEALLVLPTSKFGVVQTMGATIRKESQVL